MLVEPASIPAHVMDAFYGAQLNSEHGWRLAVASALNALMGEDLVTVSMHNYPARASVLPSAVLAAVLERETERF